MNENELVVSKELLSEVIGEEVINYGVWEDNYDYAEIQIAEQEDSDIINNFQLAHLFKLWTLENGYEIVESVEKTQINKDGNLVYYAKVQNEESPYDPFKVFYLCEVVYRDMNKNKELNTWSRDE